MDIAQKASLNDLKRFKRFGTVFKDGKENITSFDKLEMASVTK